MPVAGDPVPDGCGSVPKEIATAPTAGTCECSRRTWPNIGAVKADIHNHNRPVSGVRGSVEAYPSLPVESLNGTKFSEAMQKVGGGAEGI